MDGTGTGSGREAREPHEWGEAVEQSHANPLEPGDIATAPAPLGIPEPVVGQDESTPLEEDEPGAVADHADGRPHHDPRQHQHADGVDPVVGHQASDHPERGQHAADDEGGDVREPGALQPVVDDEGADDVEDDRGHDRPGP